MHGHGGLGAPGRQLSGLQLAFSLSLHPGFGCRRLMNTQLSVPGIERCFFVRTKHEASVTGRLSHDLCARACCARILDIVQSPSQSQSPLQSSCSRSLSLRRALHMPLSPATVLPQSSLLVNRGHASGPSHTYFSRLV